MGQCGDLALSTSRIQQDLLNIPNLLTLTRIIAVPVAVVLLAHATPWSCFWASVCFGLAGLTDFFDGYLARRLGLVSLTGKFLDPLADKLMVMACLIQLSAMGWLSPWITILLLSRELSVQGLRQIASAEGLVIVAGQAGKWKTAFQMVGLIGLLAHYEYSINFLVATTDVNFHRVGWWFMVASLGLSVWSAGEYFVSFLKSIGDA